MAKLKRKAEAKKIQEATGDFLDDFEDDFEDSSDDSDSPRVGARRVRVDHEDNRCRSGSVRKVREFTDGYTDLEVGNVIEFVKAAKAADNHVQGLVSKKTDFRASQSEAVLFEPSSVSKLPKTMV